MIYNLTLSHPRANLGGKGLWRSPESWECPQWAEEFPQVYLFTPFPCPGCVFRATFGIFPVEYSLWEREFWLQKSRVRSGSAFTLTQQHKSCSDSAPRI